MKKVESDRKRWSIWKKLGLIVAGSTAAVLLAATVAHLAWKYSGSDEWEFVHEIDNVKVYSMKTPGEVYKKFKLEGFFESKLAGIVKLMRDPSSCDDVGCTHSYALEMDQFPQAVVYTFRYPMPEPLKAREFVVKSEFHQDPVTKEIYIDYKSVAGKMPENDCCVRVARMNNSWRFVPREGEQVYVEYIYDNPADGVPYFLVNPELEKSLHTNIPELQAVLDTEKYRTAVVDYVLEPGEMSEVSKAAGEDPSTLSLKASNF